MDKKTLLEQRSKVRLKKDIKKKIETEANPTNKQNSKKIKSMVVKLKGLGFSVEK